MITAAGEMALNASMPEHLAYIYQWLSKHRLALKVVKCSVLTLRVDKNCFLEKVMTKQAFAILSFIKVLTLKTFFLIVTWK